MQTIHCAFFIGTQIQVEHNMAAGRTGWIEVAVAVHNLWTHPDTAAVAAAVADTVVAAAVAAETT